MTGLNMSVDSFAAIDVHVHLEPVEDNTVDAAAKKYFGDSGAPRDHKGLADYYRSRKIAFVIFAVDERLTGKPRVSNEEVVQFANENSDIAIPAPFVPVAGRSYLHLSPQTERLHRPFGLVTKIFLAYAHSICQYTSQEQSDVRFRLSFNNARPLAIRFRKDWHP